VRASRGRASLRGIWAARMRGRCVDPVGRAAVLMVREVLAKGREMWRSWGG
jgi:hypothetical protein